jgi:hypothetical protein
VSRWRVRSKEAIRRALAELPPDATIDAKHLAIDAAYPFGIRRHFPYKIWLEERSAARGELAGIVDPGDPLARPCPACGRSRGKRCIDLETRKTISTFHESRVSGGGNGPLFGDSQG